ncbi:MAG: SpaA isopeptide-forming pilin-related protein [Bacteroidota bacterium]
MKILVLAVTLALSGTIHEADAQLLPTKLRVTVIDGLGNNVEGATVLLYSNEKDYLESTNPVAELKTDKKGRVTFKDLETRSYFIEAKHQKKTNDGEGVQTAVLAEGRINKVNTVIE